MKGKYAIFVHFGDTDAAQIVYYPNYYKWMDQATHHMFRSNQFSIKQLQMERQIIIPLLEASCTFYRSLTFEDEVNVFSTIVEVERKVFHINHRFERIDGTLIAEGKETRGWVSIEGEKPRAIEITETIKEKLKG